MSDEGPFYHINKGLVLCIDINNISVPNIEGRQVLTERTKCMLTGNCRRIQGADFIEILIPDIGLRWVNLEQFEQRSFPIEIS